jgi:Aspartate/tyrosine/aromatic aminotransferase
MLNSPHNPTGAVLMEEDIRQLSAIVKDTNIFIVSDEVYEHLIFDNIPHQSILRYPELLKEVLFAFLSAKPITVPGGSLVIVSHLLHQWSSSEKFTSSIVFVVTLLHRLRWQIS